VCGFAGHFYLTKLLLPVLLSTAESSPPGTVRVVNLSSVGHHFAGLNFNTFRDGPARLKMTRNGLYCQSKNVRFAAFCAPIPHGVICDDQGNVVFATELARRYGDRGIVSTSVHPGNHSALIPTPGKRIIRRDLNFRRRHRIRFAQTLAKLCANVHSKADPPLVDFSQVNVIGDSTLSYRIQPKAR
jgi:NAD(P)-dependent dehydrogenase (short-subunit alcohol dehydrogenase family)